MSIYETNSDTTYKVLLSLVEGTKRFNELSKEGKKATVARSLTRLLKQKYVTRTISKTKPIKSFYSITKNGRTVLFKKSISRIKDLRVELNRLELLVKS